MKYELIIQLVLSSAKTCGIFLFGPHALTQIEDTSLYRVSNSVCALSELRALVHSVSTKLALFILSRSAEEEEKKKRY